MPAQALICHDLVKFFGDLCVLDGVNLVASPGQRLGLVGENGAGKSTLLKLLSGMDTPDAGTVERPSDIGLLHQELPYAVDQTVAEVIADALVESRELLRRLDELLGQPERLAEYGEVLTRAEELSVWDAERRALEIVDGLGLGAIAHERTLGTLSGGQRSRLALAALLIRRPAALLLDEPTNHLDDEALSFMEEQLRQLSGVVVVASHDRVFLDEVCTDIVDIDPARGGVTRFGGAYTEYLAAKQAERARWEQAFADQQDQMRALRVAIKTTARQVAPYRMRRDGNKMSYDAHGEKVQASVSSRVRNAKQRLETIERAPVGKPPAILRFQAPLLTTDRTPSGSRERSPAEIQGGLCLSARALEVPGRLRLDRLVLPSNGRLLVTGANGSGKSTLLAVLHGDLAPRSGTVLRRKGLRVALLAQDDVWPDLSRTPRELYGDHRIPLIDLGLIAPKDLDRPIGTLSVGQRRRLALALVIAQPPDVLLLDEPTNHLSLMLADELERALGTAPGAVIVASHDRWLRRRWNGARLHL